MTLTLEERRAALPGLAPRELSRIDWLHDELLSTEDARARLRSWIAAGRPVVAPEQLAFVGDDEIRGVVHRALGLIPPPVVHYLVTSCLVIEVGRSAKGFWCAFPPFSTTPQLIAISGSNPDNVLVAGVFAHEGAHAWLEPRDLPVPMTAEERLDRKQTLYRLADEWGFSVPYARAGVAERRERRAAALAARWGFQGPAADAVTCGRAEHRRVLALEQSKEEIA